MPPYCLPDEDNELQQQQRNNINRNNNEHQNNQDRNNPQRPPQYNRHDPSYDLLRRIYRDRLDNAAMRIVIEENNNQRGRHSNREELVQELINRFRDRETARRNREVSDSERIRQQIESREIRLFLAEQRENQD